MTEIWSFIFFVMGGIKTVWVYGLKVMPLSLLMSDCKNWMYFARIRKKFLTHGTYSYMQLKMLTKSSLVTSCANFTNSSKYIPSSYYFSSTLIKVLIWMLSSSFLRRYSLLELSLRKELPYLPSIWSGIFFNTILISANSIYSSPSIS